MLYDVRFRLDSAERSIQGLWKRVGNEMSKTRDEVLQEVESYLAQRDDAGSSGGADIGQALLMQMLSGGMAGQQQQEEPADRMDAIDHMLIGSGGDNGDH